MAQNTEAIITWSSFWAYFISPSCDNEMRMTMAKDLRLPEFLENISANGQIEVLEDAPVSIVKAPSIWKALKPKTIQTLGLAVEAKPVSSMQDTVDALYKKKGWVR